MLTYEMRRIGNNTKDNEVLSKENSLNTYHLINEEQNINYPSYDNFIMSRFNNYNNLNLNSKLFLSENDKNDTQDTTSEKNKKEIIRRKELIKDYYNNLNFISKNDKLIPFFHGLKISNKFNKDKHNFYNDLENLIKYNNVNKYNDDDNDRKNDINNYYNYNNNIVNSSNKNDNCSFINNTIDEKRNIYKDNNRPANFSINNNSNSNYNKVNSLYSIKKNIPCDYLNNASNTNNSSNQINKMHLNNKIISNDNSIKDYDNKKEMKIKEEKEPRYINIYRNNMTEDSFNYNNDNNILPNKKNDINSYNINGKKDYKKINENKNENINENKGNNRNKLVYNLDKNNEYLNYPNYEKK
jgi:hypothetical protein